jgi:hypothetical protein
MAARCQQQATMISAIALKTDRQYSSAAMFVFPTVPE